MTISSLEDAQKVFKKYGFKFGRTRGMYTSAGWGRWVETFYEVKDLKNIGTYYDGEMYSVKKGRGKPFTFHTGQSAYSCAIPNIGSFVLRKDTPPEVIAAALQLAQFVDKKQGYFQCVTLDKPEWKEVNEALPMAGFREVKRIESQHGGYMNIIWEWME